MLSSIFTYNRAIASRLSPLLARTSLRPNDVTLLSLAAGLVCAWCMSLGTRAAMLSGALFLHLSFILDNCDGQIARIKNMQSRFGMWLDYVCDLLVDMALWVGLALGAVRGGVTPAIYGIAALACAGSAMNFGRVVYFRAHRPAPARPGSVRQVIDTMSDDGDPSALVWLMAVIGYPGYLLLFGCAYIYFIWFFGISGKRP
ncbi:MAG: hypothetical protein MOGMAGMI_01647 [Candidatus Omnitrophica bacterium]|nr:hypothetical protein [Candidatus Omnitrophota bacterium]